MAFSQFPAPAAGGAVKQRQIQEFTSSGTFTVPAGVFSVEIG